ncbi:MAG TPA: TonB-dependent receptor [Bacteroidia bacterium]|nr:TonB-dependent receptor [Bacteroidia bacterium]HNT79976.1 TonB-dependent receptor [Bacteroidia bacterium]
MRKLQSTLVFVFILLMCSSAVLAQSGTATVRGFVYEKASGEPLPFTNVYLAKTTYGAATDEHGFFNISKIRPGDYILNVQALGFDSIGVALSLKSGDIVTQKLYVQKRAVELGNIEISAEKQERQSEVKMSVTKVTPKDIEQLPSIGGQADLAQYLQVLPGVVSTGDQGGQLYIRGGTPIQNMVLLDGMIVYNPFHSIGLFSVFDTDIISTADVYTGGYNSEYGGRISSVMDIRTKDGNKKRNTGNLGVNPFLSKVLLEGPIKKAKTDGDGTSSYIISAKHSYLDQSSKSLYSYISDEGLPYSFTDFYGKISLNSDNGSKLNLFGFNFKDKVQYANVSDLNWNSSGFGSSFILIPASSNVFLTGGFAYSTYDITLQEGDDKPRFSSIDGFNVNIGFKNFIGKDYLHYGIELLGFKTNFEFFNISNLKIEQVENTTEIAAFAKYRYVHEKIVLEPGLRFHYYASLNDPSFEPRLGAKYNINESVRIKLAAGMYSQNLLSSVSDRDVVNLFYGFLSGPDNLPKEFDDEKVNTRLQKSQHLLLGAEVDVFENVVVNIEGYYKFFKQLSNLNRDKIYPDNAANANIEDVLKKDFIIERGNATGLDLSLKYSKGPINLWTVYSLSYVDRYDGIRTYTPHFDRRHNVNFVGSYTFGKSKLWHLDARWNFGTGFPFTETTGFYEYLNFEDGITTDYETANGTLGTLFGELNNGKLPAYHRLDIAVKRTFVLGEHSNLEIIGSIINAYNHGNIFYFDRIRYERVDQLPIIPAIGVNLTW